MKLFIWADVYPVNYGDSMLIVVAETLEEAKTLAKNGTAYSFGIYRAEGIPEVRLGEPTRVVDAPCAEWHAWAE